MVITCTQEKKSGALSCPQERETGAILISEERNWVYRTLRHRSQDATAQNTTAQVATALDYTAHFVIKGGRHGTFLYWGGCYDTICATAHVVSASHSSSSEIQGGGDSGS